MAKIERKTQQIFCLQGGSQQITAFGTAKNETPTFTNDIEEIQNTNFLYGWSSALLTDKAPFMEDSNALFYLITRQLAYLFQEGIPEYDANTNYSQYAFARAINSSNIYVSLIPNNLGNDITDSQFWKLFISDGSIAQYEIGKPEITLSNSLLTNEIWLEGQTVSRLTYSNLFNIYGTTYGIGDGSTTFKLPDFRNRAIWGSETFGYLNAGLPDHYHNIDGMPNFINMPRGDDRGNCVTYSITGKSRNASETNSIYGNSDTVQPPSIKVRVKTRYY